jgi:hypothetical protein
MKCRPQEVSGDNAAQHSAGTEGLTATGLESSLKLSENSRKITNKLRQEQTSKCEVGHNMCLQSWCAGLKSSQRTNENKTIEFLYK